MFAEHFTYLHHTSLFDKIKPQPPVPKRPIAKLFTALLVFLIVPEQRTTAVGPWTKRLGRTFIPSPWRKIGLGVASNVGDLREDSQWKFMGLFSCNEVWEFMVAEWNDILPKRCVQISYFPERRQYMKRRMNVTGKSSQPEADEDVSNNS